VLELRVSSFDTVDRRRNFALSSALSGNGGCALLSAESVMTSLWRDSRHHGDAAAAVATRALRSTRSSPPPTITLPLHAAATVFQGRIQSGD